MSLRYSSAACSTRPPGGASALADEGTSTEVGLPEYSTLGFEDGEQALYGSMYSSTAAVSRSAARVAALQICPDEFFLAAERVVERCLRRLHVR